jgi:hypothetical protein
MTTVQGAHHDIVMMKAEQGTSLVNIANDYIWISERGEVAPAVVMLRAILTDNTRICSIQLTRL